MKMIIIIYIPESLFWYWFLIEEIGEKFYIAVDVEREQNCSLELLRVEKVGSLTGNVNSLLYYYIYSFSYWEYSVTQLQSNTKI